VLKDCFVLYLAKPVVLKDSCLLYFAKPVMFKDCFVLYLAKPVVLTLKKILEREDQYLYVARRTFTNLFLGVSFLNLLCAVPSLTQLSLEIIYL
jgi:hypothetical protein